MKKIILLSLLILNIQNLSYANNSDYTTPKPVRYSTQQGIFRIEKTIYASDQELDMIKKAREAEAKERFPNGVLPGGGIDPFTQNEPDSTQEPEQLQNNKTIKNKFINATKEMGKELLLGL
ncbi:hypothetical protein IKU74_02705 [bacterium]|nr:hypothetical protein [bacterium]